MAIIVVSALVLTCVPAYVLADAGSDAADDPMTVSLFDSQGSTAVGNLLDDKSIWVDTYKNLNTGKTECTIEWNTQLVSDTRYLMISPEDAGSCALSLTVVRNAGFILDSGITFAFYTDTTYSSESCVGTLTYTDETAEEQDLSRLLTAGKPYYIRAWTTEDYTWTTEEFSATELKSLTFYSVDLKFVATTASDMNAVFYHMNDGSDEDIVYSNLVKNGHEYGAMPVVTREDYTLAGWFTDPALGTVVHPDDIVNLSEELHLYAHWIKQGSEVIHVDEDENDTWIWVDVSEDSIHVKIDGESYSTRVVTTYDEDVEDGTIVVDTHNTASDFLVQDASDANEQYSVVRQKLTEKGFNVENYIVISYNESVSCEEGSLAKLLETDCNDFRVVGDALSISLDSRVIADLSEYPGETIIETIVAPANELTEEQRLVLVGNTAYEISIKNSGNEIERFDGVITAWFAYEAPSNMSSIQVYCVNDDGTTEAMQFDYKDGIVTFKTSHLSVFYVEVETEEEGPGFEWWYIPIAAGIMLLGYFLIAKKRKHRNIEGEIY